MHQEEVKYEDFTNYIVDTYKYVESWAPQYSVFNPQSAWEKFSKLWSNENHKDFLKSAVHWYIQANAQSGYIEGSLIMAQVALELIYNWFIIEERKLISGDDAKSISASNKIRLLLSVIGIPYKTPCGLNNLQQYKTNNKDIIDGPEAIVQLRNAIVHGQLEKRKKFSMISSFTKAEALDLCLWYIELSMLFILEYNGKYTYRCSGAMWKGSSEQELPWVAREYR